EIRARLQSASPSTRWTELDDVKKLLKGSRSSSSSPPRSPTNTLPIPKKASVDTHLESHSGDTYIHPSNARSSTPKRSKKQWTIHFTSKVLLFCGLAILVYGMQNNLATSGGAALIAHGLSAGTGERESQQSLHSEVMGQGASVPSSPGPADDVFAKDYKFMLLEKENTPAKKESERLVMSKNSGKQFTSTTSANGLSSFSEDSLKREKKMISRTRETTTASAGQLRDLVTFIP
uniref:Uncharacterized protein n=1 Tax=Electrophorus electricus TaxID=8005 RepID=A0A4W4H057_ELEEL